MVGKGLGALIAGGVVAVAVALGLYYYNKPATTTPPPASPTATLITISQSASPVAVGQVDTISGTAYDTSGKPLPSYPLYLFANGKQAASGMTGNDGTYSFPATFAAAGTYTLDVSDSTSNS